MNVGECFSPEAGGKFEEKTENQFLFGRMMTDAIIVQYFHREQMRVSWRNPATSS
jgi:hypothetical protein